MRLAMLLPLAALAMAPSSQAGGQALSPIQSPPERSNPFPSAQGQVPRAAPTFFFPDDAQSIGDRLWVLEDSGVFSIPGSPDVEGRLEEINLTSGSGRVLFERGVIGIAKAERRLYILREDRAPSGYAVEVIDGQKRSLLPPLPALPAGDYPAAAALGVAASPGKVVVISRLGALVFQDGVWRRLELKVSPSSQRWGEDHRVSGVNMPVSGSAYFVAYAPGFLEIDRSGGIERVDLKTGQVTRPRSFALTTCGGAISIGCEEVGAPVPDRQQPDCVLAPVNSRQNRQSRIARVCGGSVSLAYESPCEEDCEKDFKSIDFVADLAKGFAFGRGGEVIYVPPRPDKPRSFKPPALRQMGAMTVDASRPDMVLVAGFEQGGGGGGFLAVGRE